MGQGNEQNDPNCETKQSEQDRPLGQGQEGGQGTAAQRAPGFGDTASTERETGAVDGQTSERDPAWRPGDDPAGQPETGQQAGGFDTGDATGDGEREPNPAT